MVCDSVSENLGKRGCKGSEPQKGGYKVDVNAWS